MSRIGVIGPVAPDYFAENVGDALQRLGHVVTQLGPAHPRGRGRLFDRAGGLTRQALPRLMNVPRTGSYRPHSVPAARSSSNLDTHLVPSVVTRLRSRGARVAFWFPDSVANLGRQLMLLAPYDAIFFKEPRLTDRLRATPAYQSTTCPAGLQSPLAPADHQAGTEPCLVIAGNMYPSRVRLLEQLIAKGIPLRLYGGGFPRWLGETAARAVHTGLTCIAGDRKGSIWGLCGHGCPGLGMAESAPCP